MRIDLASAGKALTKARRERIRRRVLLSMSRFERDVRDVRVRLRRSTNALGSVDEHCTVRARLRSGRTLEAEVIDGQPDEAAGRAARRLALLVAAVLDGGLARPRVGSGGLP